jgi:hypothetical protein
LCLWMHSFFYLIYARYISTVLLAHQIMRVNMLNVFSA